MWRYSGVQPRRLLGRGRNGSAAAAVVAGCSVVRGVPPGWVSLRSNVLFKMVVLAGTALEDSG